MSNRPISGAVVVGVGMAMVFGPIVTAVAMGKHMPQAMFPLLGLTVIFGFMIWTVGLFRRAGDAAQRLAAKGFSWCRGCGYPFDPRTEDHQWVLCSECGRHFRAGEEREWLKIHPERVRVDQ